MKCDFVSGHTHTFMDYVWDVCSFYCPFVLHNYVLWHLHIIYYFREEIAGYDGKLTKEMSGPIYEVFSRLIRALVGKKIAVPGKFKRCG